MANFFEQFHDSPEPAAPSGTANFFARFHPEPAARGAEPTFDDRFNAVTDEAAFRAKEPPKKFGLEDTWPAKIAKSIYSAVTLPGDVISGKAHVPGSEDAQAIPGAVPFGSPNSSGERIGDLAMVATPLSAATGSGKLIAEGAGLAKPRVQSTAAPTIEELKAAARADYQSPEVVGLEVKPTTIKDYSTGAKSALNNEGFDENVAPKTFGILSKLESIPTGATVTGQNFNSLRKMLGKAASSVEPSEKAAASMAIEHLDSFIPSIPRSELIAGDVGAAADKLATARGNYSAAKQAEKIYNKLVQAEVRAASANSGMNVANTIRQRMADVVLKPKEQRGLRPEEIQAAQDISEGTRTQNTLRAAGNILGGGGGLGTAIVGAIGGVATGGPGATLPIVGFALKALANKLTVRQAEKLSEMIRSRAPLASSAQKFEDRAADFARERNGRTIAAVSLAARNLANNLRSSGMNISTSDLMGGLQMSGTGRAEQQQ